MAGAGMSAGNVLGGGSGVGVGDVVLADGGVGMPLGLEVHDTPDVGSASGDENSFDDDLNADDDEVNVKPGADTRVEFDDKNKNISVGEAMATQLSLAAVATAKSEF